VVYDTTKQLLTVQDAPRERLVDLHECPYCRRPYGRDFEHSDGDSEDDHHAYSGVDEDRPFLDPNYFAMLAASTRVSPANTEPGTPTGRRLQPAALRSGRSRDVSGAAGPPSGAEFVTSEPTPAASRGISSSAFNPGYFQQHFREQAILGRGGNGVVLLVEHLMDGVALGHFACKRVPVGNDHAWLEKVLIEVNLLRQTSHPNLVPCHWVWLEDHQPTTFGPPVPCLWILQDYCNGGDLHNYVLGPKEQSSEKEIMKERMRRRSRGDATPPADLRGPSKLTFDEIFSFFRDITSGLHHLHSKGYIHRDLKPSNCLLKHDGAKTRALISDFGEMQVTGSKRGNTGATGTISYCAPEVLRHNEADGVFGDFTTKSDIFSLGMIVYFMCFGRLPYVNADGIDEDSEDLDELRAEITAWAGFNDESRMRHDLPEKLYKYLKRLLSVDPNQRPSTEEILVSIKAGAGLGDIFSDGTDDGPSRVSPVESPRPSPSPRRPSTILSRPGLSGLRNRHSNSGDRQLARSPSPSKRSGTFAGTNDSVRPRSAGSSVMVRPKHIELPPPHVDAGTSPQQSPRLMLPPPPPQTAFAQALAYIFHPPTTTIPAIRCAIFLIKAISLFAPCAPFVASSWLLYPLLALAAVDLGVLSFRWDTSWTLLAVHLGVVYVASQRGKLCEGERVAWDGIG
jgi:serine/threonine protein kinase